MYRYGHTGIDLIVYAPVAYVFLITGQPALALLCGLGILVIEPLPDRDFRVPFLTHRGISHSLVTALLIGLVMASVGWLVGRHVLPPVVQSLQELTVINLANSENILRDLLDYDAEAFSVIGFSIGAFGIVAHLLGDMITVRGIRPFLPFCRRRVSLFPLHSDSIIANSTLFVLGILAIAIVIFTALPSVGYVPATAEHSPIGVAAGQPQNQTNATVEIANQTSNGSTVTIRRTRLPEGGFITIHESGYVDGAEPADSSIIAVSRPLDAGTHRNVTVKIANAPPGNFPGLNQSRLNTSQTVAATAYRDTNQNGRFDYVRTVGSIDDAYRSGGTPVSDTAGITVPRSEKPRPTASVTFTDQRLQNNTLVVRRAQLPDGGFIVAYNASYRRTGDPLSSAVGLSRYLPPGRHSNITVEVLPSGLDRSQVVTVRPAMDTNGNQRYDYVRSNGFQDVGYPTRNRSNTVASSAQVRVPPSQQSSQTEISSPNPTSTATDTVSPTMSSEPTSATANKSAGEGSGNLPFLEIGIGLIVLVGAVFIVHRLR